MLHRTHGLLMLIVVIAAIALLSACDSPSIPKATPTPATPTPTRTPAPTPTITLTPTPPAPKSKDSLTFTYLTSHEPDSLDPHIDYTLAGSGVIQNIYEGLITFDGSNPDKFVPLIAESIPDPAVNDDGSVTYTWVIPRGLKFHNGDDLSAQDAAYSLWRAMLLGSDGAAAAFIETPRTPGFLLLDAFFGIDDATLLVDPSGKMMGDPNKLQSAKSSALRAACQRVTEAVSFDNAARTVTMKLPRPYAPLLSTLAGPWAVVVDRTWLAQQGDWDGDCRTWQYFYGMSPETDLIRDRANGTGPYALDHWTPGAELVLVAHSGYRSGAAKINRIVIKPVPAFEDRLAQLRSRDADLIEGDDWLQLDKLVREECDSGSGQCTVTHPNGLLRVYKNLPSSIRSNVFFNFAIAKDSSFIGSGQLDGQGVPPEFFADVHVRRAFNTCFDRARFITDTLAGDGQQPLALTLPGMPGYDGSPAYPFDLNQCAEEFKAAEFKTKDGQTLWDIGFQLQLPYNTTNPVQQSVAKILAENMAKINPAFVVTATALSSLEYAQALRASQLPLAVSSWQEDIHDPHNWYAPYFMQTYLTRFDLPKDLADNFAALIDQGVSQIDAAQRAAIYGELNRQIHDDAVLVNLPYRDVRYYEPTYLKGWYGKLSANPLVAEPGYLYERSEK